VPVVVDDVGYRRRRRPVNADLGPKAEGGDFGAFPPSGK